jgi:hypothetical protein
MADVHLYEYMRLVYTYIPKPPAATRKTSARTSAWTSYVVQPDGSTSDRRDRENGNEITGWGWTLPSTVVTEDLNRWAADGWALASEIVDVEHPTKHLHLTLVRQTPPPG